MRNIIIILIFIGSFMPSLIKSQEIVVYSTFENFQNKKGNSYHEYWLGGRTLMGVGKYELTVKNKQGKKNNIDCSNKWGFTYKGVLFRIEDNRSYRLMFASDHLCYYEVGYAHLESMKSGSKRVSFVVDGSSISFLSKSISSPLISVASNSGNNEAINKKGTKQLKQKLPEDTYIKLFDCLKGNITMDKLRSCSDIYANGEAKKEAVQKLSKSEQRIGEIESEQHIYFSTTEVSSSSGSTAIKMTYQVGIGGKLTKLTKKGANLGPLLKNDPKAYAQFKKGEKAWEKFNKYKIVMYATYGVMISSVGITLSGFLKKEDGESFATPSIIGGASGFAVSYLGYYLISRKMDTEMSKIHSNFRKSCEIYNENLLNSATAK